MKSKFVEIGSGALFRNDEAIGNQPPYSGNLEIRGEKVRIAAWIQEKEGKKYFSLRVAKRLSQCRSRRINQGQQFQTRRFRSNASNSRTADPKDDHHEDEQISESGEVVLRRRECIHDFQEIGGDLAECRLCGERSRFSNYRGSDRVMIRFTTLPKAHQLLYVPRSMLDQVLLDHFDRYSRSGELEREILERKGRCFKWVRLKLTPLNFCQSLARCKRLCKIRGDVRNRPLGISGEGREKRRLRESSDPPSDSGSIREGGSMNFAFVKWYPAPSLPEPLTFQTRRSGATFASSAGKHNPPLCRMILTGSPLGGRDERGNMEGNPRQIRGGRRKRRPRESKDAGGNEEASNRVGQAKRAAEARWKKKPPDPGPSNDAGAYAEALPDQMPKKETEKEREKEQSADLEDISLRSRIAGLDPSSEAYNIQVASWASSLGLSRQASLSLPKLLREARGAVEGKRWLLALEPRILKPKSRRLISLSNQEGVWTLVSLA